MKENYSFWRVLFFLVRRRVCLLVLLALDTLKYQIPRVVITFFSAKTQEFMAVPTKIEPCLLARMGDGTCLRLIFTSVSLTEV